jgi:uncharacterized RDD family membrane protein YckC
MTDATPRVGALASFGQRLLAFVVDSALSIGVAIISGRMPGDDGYGLVVYLAFLAIELLFVSTVGQTQGMRVAGIAVVRAADRERARLGWVLVRTALLAAVVPALIPDRTGRPMHDRAAATLTVRTR